MMTIPDDSPAWHLGPTPFRQYVGRATRRVKACWSYQGLTNREPVFFLWDITRRRRLGVIRRERSGTWTVETLAEDGYGRWVSTASDEYHAKQSLMDQVGSPDTTPTRGNSA